MVSSLLFSSRLKRRCGPEGRLDSASPTRLSQPDSTRHRPTRTPAASTDRGRRRRTRRQSEVVKRRTRTLPDPEHREALRERDDADLEINSNLPPKNHQLFLSFFFLSEERRGTYADAPTPHSPIPQSVNKRERYNKETRAHQTTSRSASGSPMSEMKYAYRTCMQKAVCTHSASLSRRRHG